VFYMPQALRRPDAAPQHEGPEWSRMADGLTRVNGQV
jgi:hypothetical protein